ncbi:MAG: hypothetical protein LBJ47_11360 [Tannerella sp.]|nr:hypothetical protein [Tannerella sp.]
MNQRIILFQVCAFLFLFSPNVSAVGKKMPEGRGLPRFAVMSDTHFENGSQTPRIMAAIEYAENNGRGPAIDRDTRKTDSAIMIPNVRGDGVFDDTKGLQDLLDTGGATIFLPKPAKNYLISRTLKIHSGQTLIVDRNAVIRLADRAGAHLLTNAEPARGDSNITVIGGIWDGNNLTQTTLFHSDRAKYKDQPYDRDVYLGVLMVFDNVKNLHVRDVIFKDPEMFAFLGGNLYQFTIENIIFDFNMRRGNMDGIHIAGNSHFGRIVNLKGATNDDLVALNADDIPLLELARGPITDIQVDGIFAEDAHRPVRLNSCGSPVKRVKISNIFGTYPYEAVILANHKVHPDNPIVSTFEDISLEGIFCTNSTKCMNMPHIRVFSPGQVTNLTIRDYHRTEEAVATDNILVEKGASVNCLTISDATLNNKSEGTISFVNNQGLIGVLNLSNVFLQGTSTRKVQLLKNEGTIQTINKSNVSEKNY